MLTIHLNDEPTEITAIENSQCCLNKIIKWCRLNRLTLNEGKTKHLCITQRKQVSTVKIDAGGTFLGNVKKHMIAWASVLIRGYL